MWALCAFGLYAVVFVTGRYIAPFVVLFWAGVLASLTLPDAPPYRRLLTASGGILALVVWINIGALNLEGATSLLGYSTKLPSDPSRAADSSQFSDGPSATAPAIAEGLRELGFGEGDRVGFIGNSFTAFWARLARVRIVAEIAPKEASAFWSADERRQSEVLRVFVNAGAKALVARPMDPSIAIPAGWQPVGQTGYFIHFLR